MKKRFLPYINRRFAHTFGAAGDFTASEHLEFLLKAEEVWAEGKFKDDLEPHVDVALKQLEKQTARFSELDNPMKDNKVNITWIKSCNIVATDFVREDETCEIEADEMESDTKEYEMTLLKKTGFSIDEEKLRTNTYTKEELVAHGLMRCDKVLSEYWASQLLTFYKASVGPNIPVIRGVAAPFTWDNVAKTSNIPAASYNVGIVASLLKQMQLNQVKNGWFVESGDLFEAWTNAGLNSGNLDGKGNDLRTKQIDLTFDMWNFLAAGLTEGMFLIDRNAIAWKTYTRYTDAIQVLGGQVNQTRYRMKSNILPGVYWDVIYVLKCTDGKIIHTWQLMSQGGIFLNPEQCPITIDGTDYTPNGVYSFTKTA